MIHKPELLRVTGAKMNHQERIRYVMDNLIERKQCNECLGMWFLFNHYGEKAYYRLSPVAPEDCGVCRPIDIEIEQNSVVSQENWVEL